jgi:hypothetical protein
MAIENAAAWDAFAERKSGMAAAPIAFNYGADAKEVLVKSTAKPDIQRGSRTTGR